MGRKRKYRFSNGINGTDRFYYPYRYMPPELNGTRYLDLCAEFSGSDLMLSDTDPDGSYTGVPTDDTQPVQDADDL